MNITVEFTELGLQSTTRSLMNAAESEHQTMGTRLTSRPSILLLYSALHTI